MRAELSSTHPVQPTDVLAHALAKHSLASFLPALPPVPRHYRLKIGFTLGCAVLLLAAISVVFWYQDGRYSLPTPRPPALATVNVGDTIKLPAPFPPGSTASNNDTRPLFLHFFNPDCPCSRFNATHVRELRERFGSSVRFVAVVQSFGGQDESHRQESLAAAARLFGPDMEALVDTDGKIAAACGVYSTPQAAILAPGSSRVLLFRGNYNASRYCADPQTEFARLALTAIVNHQPLPAESRAAMLAYGCELPANVDAMKNPLGGLKL